MTQETDRFFEDVNRARRGARIATFVLALCAGAAIIAATWVALSILWAPAAKAEALYVVPVVPTVPGMRTPPSPAPFYRSRPTVNVRPSAAVYALPEGAPPNNCDRPAFEVVSGPKAQRGCYGGP